MMNHFQGLRKVEGQLHVMPKPRRGEASLRSPVGTLRYAQGDIGDEYVRRGDFENTMEALLKGRRPHRSVKTIGIPEVVYLLP